MHTKNERSDLGLLVLATFPSFSLYFMNIYVFHAFVADITAFTVCLNDLQVFSLVFNDFSFFYEILCAFHQFHMISMDSNPFHALSWLSRCFCVVTDSSRLKCVRLCDGTWPQSCPKQVGNEIATATSPELGSFGSTLVSSSSQHPRVEPLANLIRWAGLRRE